MTVPRLLLDAAAARPNAVALRKKELGRWREYMFAEYAERAARVGLGLRAIGVGSGDRVAIQCGNRPAWLLADVGIQGIGAVSVGVDPDADAAASLPLLADAVAVVAEDEEQLDKVLELRDRLPHLGKVVVVDPRGIRTLEPLGMTFTELEKLGGEDPVEEWGRLVAGLDDDRHAVVVRGSAVLTARQLVERSEKAEPSIGGGTGDEVVSFLPLDRLDERLVSQVAALQRGFVVNFGEGVDSLASDMREVQPTILLAAAAVWELTMAGVELRMGAASGFKRAVYKRFIGGRGGPVGGVLLHRPLRSKLGMSRVRNGISVGPPLAPHVVDFFTAIGVPVREVGTELEA